MKIENNPKFERKSLLSINDVMLALEELEHDLPSAQLELLKNFNNTYLIITRNVRQQMKKGVFTHPDFLTQFDTQFAHYYLHALRGYLRGHKIAPAWQAAFDSAKSKRVSNFKCMALGVNAHVNNDIAQVLLDCKANRQHFKDFLRINNIIENSIYEVIDSLGDDPGPIHPKQNLTKALYKFVMKYLIKVWRLQAWRKFRKLERESMSVGSIERSAAATADELTKLPV